MTRGSVSSISEGGVASVRTAGLAAADASRDVQRVLRVLQHGARGLVKHPTGRGELDAPRGPVKEGVADAAFQALNLLGQRRLRDVQPCGGATEMELLGQHDEIAEVGQFQSVDDPGHSLLHHINQAT